MIHILDTLCIYVASVIYQHLEPIELREVGNKYLLAVRKVSYLRKYVLSCVKIHFIFINSKLGGKQTAFV